MARRPVIRPARGRTIDPGFSAGTRLPPGIDRQFRKNVGRTNIDPGFAQPGMSDASPLANAITARPGHGHTIQKPPARGARLAAAAAPGYSTPVGRDRLGTPPAPKPVKQKQKPTVPPGQVPKVAAAINAQPTPEDTIFKTYVQPLIDSITNANTLRSQQGTAAIQAGEDALQKYLATVDYGAPYRQAESSQSAVDANLAQSLKDAGLSLSGDLASRLAVINDPTVGAAAGAVANTGNVGAAGITEQGSHALTQLIADEAAAGAYGAKQPGIAGLAGIQNIGKLQGQISTDQATQLGDLSAKVPSMISSILAAQPKTKFISRKDGIYAVDPTTGQAILLPGTASSSSSGSGSVKTISRKEGIFAVGPDGSLTKLWSPTPGSTVKPPKFRTVKGVVLRENPDGTLTPVYTAPGGSGGSGGSSSGRVNTTLSKAYGYLVDNNGNPIMRNGKTVPLPGAKKGGGLTPGEIATREKRAGQIATQAFEGVPGSQTVTVYEDKTTGDQYQSRKAAISHGVDPTNIVKSTQKVEGRTHLSYQEAIRQARAEGIPLPVIQDALNVYWKRGETKPWEKPGQGRPQQSYQERNPGKAGAADAAAAKTPEGAKQAAFQIARQRYGWTDSELAALDQLMQGESGWNYHAWNNPYGGPHEWLADYVPPKGAFGIGQALGHQLPADYATNPVTQINWMLKYVHDRYGTPSRALAFWQGNNPHWY